MRALFARLADASRRGAALIVAVSLILAFIGGWFVATNVSIDTDIEKLISPDLPWRLQEAAYDKAFPQNSDLLVAVIDAATPDQAEDAAQALATRLAADKSLFRTVRRPDGGTFFKRNGLLFLPKAEVQSVADQLIAAQPLIGSLAADPSLRGLFGALDLVAQGLDYGQVKEKDLDGPFMGVTAAVEAALNGRHQPMSWQVMLTGRAPDPLELRRFVLIQPVLDYSALEPGAPAEAAVRDAAATLGLTPANGIRLRLTGPVALSDAQFSTLSQGAGLSTVLSLGLLLVWLILALRSLRLTLAILVTLIVGLVACASFAVGVVGAFNPISVAFAVLFVGIAIDFGIQFSVRYREERTRSDDLAVALREAASGIGGPLAIAAGATAVGFFSFIPTDYTGVSQLGLIAGVGMLIALALNLTLLPALLTLLRPRSEGREVGFPRMAPVDRFMHTRRAPVIAAAAILAIASIAVLTGLRFDFNPLNLQNPREEAVATLYDLMASPRTTPNTIEILAPSLQAATTLGAKLEKLPEVAQVATAASYVPDDQPQKMAILQDAAQLIGPTLDPPQQQPAPSNSEVLDAIKHCAQDLKDAAKSGDPPAVTRLAAALDAVLARGAGVLPTLNANLTAGLAARLGDLRLSLQPRAVTVDTLPPDIKDDWITADGRARVQVFPRGDARDNAVLRRFAAAVQKIAPDATGTPVTIQKSADTVVRAFAIAGLIAIVAIAILLSVVLRRARDVALVLIPLLLAGLLTLATGVLAGLPLNFANVIALPLLLGIGVAFDIYFVMRWRAGHADLLQSSTARAVLFSALTTGTAFGSLALSSYPGTADMGKLLILALFYTVLCTFFILPALLGPLPVPPRKAP